MYWVIAIIIVGAGAFALVKWRGKELTDLKEPWLRGTLDELFCSKKCYDKAGHILFTSTGRSGRCDCCGKEVTYGRTGNRNRDAGLSFQDGESVFVCIGCAKMARKTNRKGRKCVMCGERY